MILVTSAGGKTGRAMISTFSKSGEPIRAMMREPATVDERAPLLRGFAALLQPLQPVHHLGVAEPFVLDHLEEHLDAVRQVAVPAREVLERGDNLQARGRERVLRDVRVVADRGGPALLRVS